MNKRITTACVVLGVLVNVAASNTVTLTLPTAIGVKGAVYSISNIGTNIVIVAPYGSQTVSGYTTYTNRTTGNGITIISDGSNWLVKGIF
jgi:hypothetical protein